MWPGVLLAVPLCAHPAVLETTRRAAAVKANSLCMASLLSSIAAAGRCTYDRNALLLRNVPMATGANARAVQQLVAMGFRRWVNPSYELPHGEPRPRGLWFPREVWGNVSIPQTRRRRRSLRLWR